jgi:cobalt-zinc-cadmium efflux system outer membrane protein
MDVGVSQELELWGKRAARQAVATTRSLTSGAEWRAKLQEVESEVRARFERALFLQERVATVDGLADLDRRVVLATQARVRDGSITPVTGRLTELDLLRLEAQGRRTHSELRQALVALGLAIGLELPDSIRLGGEVHAESLLAVEDSVAALALHTRREGEVLRRQIAVRQAELHLAEREARPNLTLGAGLARDRASFSGGDFTGDPAIVRGISGASDTDHLWTARVSMPLPLWQRNQAGRARASAEIVRSQADYDRHRQRIRLEALGAARRFQDAVALYHLYLERSARVQQDLVLIREAYADGRISLDSYLTQKGRLVDTLLGQLEAGDAYWDARGQLEATVGLDLAHLNAVGAR